jgi:hypothetical protein
MQFADPTFLDMIVRRRANYKICNPDNKTRLCWLFADAVTRRVEGDLARVTALQEWVGETAPHVLKHDMRGVSDMYRVHALDIISRGWAACEATSDLFATLCWLAGYPARVVSIQQNMAEPVTGHHVNEVFVAGKWRFFDADLWRRFDLPDGMPGSARDLQRQPEIVEAAEAARAPDAQPSSLPGAAWPVTDPQGEKMYHRLFQTIWVQEGLYSLDGFYGQWLKLAPETEVYLYDPPQHPDVQKLLEGRLPFSYVRDSTKIADHFTHAWDVDWRSWWE